MIVRELLPPPDPLLACERLRRLPERLLLDSALGGRFTYLMADPWEVADDPRVLRERMRASPLPARPDLPPFQGGAAGLVEYEWREEKPEGFRFGLYDWVLAWDRAAGRAWLVSTGMPLAGAEREERAAHRAEQILALLSAAQDDRERLPRSVPAEVRASHTEAEYSEAVREVLRRIEAGEVEQVNLAQRFESHLPADPWSLYLRLRSINPAPYSVFYDLGSRAIASASPERFLQVRDGWVETRPIKGTRPRGPTEEEDRRLADELLGSEKDRRENRITADLLLEELGPWCEAGSLRLAEFCRLEKHPTVQHLVSILEGELAPGRDPLELLLALFPGASITGRPKDPAIRCISELETSPRGPYCGSIAWWSHGGDLDSNVLIRTLVVDGQRVSFSAGGGIVRGSVPREEYMESLHKARALFEAVNHADR